MIRLFHRHKWGIIGKNFTEPRLKIDLKGYIRESARIALLRRALEGATHIYLRCETCGDLKEIDFYGKFEGEI